MQKSIIIALLALLTVAPIAEGRPESGPRTLFDEYLAALKNKDWQKAEGCWLDSEVANANRLGISYPEAPLKVDCASPLVMNLDRVISGEVEPTITDISEDSNQAILTVRLASNRDTLETTYYTQLVSDSWKMVSRLTALTRSWASVETKYARVHYADSTLLNNFALQTLDETIAGLGQALQIPQARMQELTEARIDYYICTKSDFKLLTGYDAHGITDFQSDAVIARHLPHAHELTHLMQNFALQNAPLYTQPFIQEGLAVALGGRWGKSQAVMQQLGGYLLVNQVVDPEDLLTYDGFHKKIGMPDLSYPAAGVLVGLLLDKCGVEGFQQLYRDLSGSNQAVKAMTAGEVKAKLRASTDRSWEQLVSELDSPAARPQAYGMRPDSSSLSATPLVELQAGGDSLVICEDGDDYCIRVKSTVEHPRGVLLLSDPEADVTPTYRSWMFAEQLPSEPFSGERYGICYDQNEAGLYDYFVNLLTAKFVSMFAPQSSYWNSDERTIRFRISKSLLDKEITHYKLRLASSS